MLIYECLNIGKQESENNFRQCSNLVYWHYISENIMYVFYCKLNFYLYNLKLFYSIFYSNLLATTAAFFIIRFSNLYIDIYILHWVYSHPHCCFKPPHAAIGQIVCDCQIANNNNLFVCVSDIKKNEWSPQNALFMAPECQTRLVNLNRPVSSP